MANVLVLSLVFPPDNVSTAHIMGNLASDLKRAGHNVSVITTTPHYNIDADAERRQPLRRTMFPLFRRSEFEGVPVLHVVMPRKEKSILRRLTSWSAFHVLSTIAAIMIRPRPDVIICPSPPLTIGVSAWLIALIRRARFVYNVQEIYPDIAISLGALRSKTLIAMARLLEQFVYRRSAAVTVIAPRMEQRLLERGVPQSKLLVIPNFVDTSDLEPLSKDNEFSREHSLVDKFVVNYSGNIGPAQGLETLIRTAELLRDDDRVHFVITGDGTLFEAMRNQIRDLNLTNVTILGYQPFARMAAIYASADVCIVPQAVATGSDAVPSKVYRIMACARAVLAVSEPGSDLASLVDVAQCGVSARPDAAEELAKLLASAASDRERWMAMGQCGFEYVRARYTREIITAQYERVVQRLARP